MVVRSAGKVAAPGRVLVDGVHNGGGERASRVAGMGIPAGIKSPSGDGDGKEVLPVSLHGDRDVAVIPDGEFSVDISTCSIRHT